MSKIELYTDGACSGNPGPGGWGAILIAVDDVGTIQKELPISGCEPHTTNNRMEIMAVIRGLQQLTRPTKLTIFSDSQYVINTMTKGWKKKANQELWAQLEAAAQPHQITWKYVRGHAGHEYNERCDKLAVAAIKNCSPR
ncbi:MAG: ribonuclease H [Chloroflexi bacterium OLB15]|nr:MAG: ribonuclease H [Chloroflexi bacterium OLB15]